MKICSKCLKTKSLDRFHKRANRKIGVVSLCKSCEKIRKSKISVKEYNAKYYQNNKQKFSDYQKSNADVVNATAAKRRSAKLQRTPKWLSTEQQNQIKDFYKMAKELETIFPWAQQVDHIIPLQGNNVSGFHHPDNLQILSAKMNAEKHNTYEVV
jgi:hypothetical protein